MPVVHPGALEYTQLVGRSSANPVPAGGEGGYSVRFVRVPPGPRSPHLHPHSDELTYVVSGSGTAWEGETSTPVQPGDLIVVPQGVAHATVTQGEEELVLLCFFPHPDLASNIVELDGPLRA